MDIRDWPLDKIMQLPDCCFGRKFQVSCQCRAPDGVATWDISESTLPEVFVLWGVYIIVVYSNESDNWIRIAYGDQLPTTEAMMDAYEPVLPGFGRTGAEPRRIYIYSNQGTTALKLRKPVAAAGRRLVLEAKPQAAKSMNLQVAIVVSSIPKEAPDWLISGQVKSLL